MFRLTEVVKHLIIINIIFFVASQAIGNGHTLYVLFSDFFPKNELFRVWQPLTSMFMHANQQHIFFNMLLLFFVGPPLELTLGKERFLFLYISAGLGAAIFPMIIEFIKFSYLESDLINQGIPKTEIYNILKTNESILKFTETQVEKLQTMYRVYNRQGVGASGAVSGVLAALAFWHPNHKISLIFPPITVKLKYLAAVIICSDFFSSLLVMMPLYSSDNTNYLAHIFGAFTAILIAWYWKKSEFNKNRWD